VFQGAIRFARRKIHRKSTKRCVISRYVAVMPPGYESNVAGCGLNRQRLSSLVHLRFVCKTIHSSLNHDGLMVGLPLRIEACARKPCCVLLVGRLNRPVSVASSRVDRGGCGTGMCRSCIRGVDHGRGETVSVVAETVASKSMEPASRRFPQ
jgi:hypothetical protein